MNENNEFLGLVQNGQFLILLPESADPGPNRLTTTIQMQEPRPPESAELSLREYEGSALMVRGTSGGGWIYSAEVIEVAGPILTAVVSRLFGRLEA
ncbi:MAG: hypothetical protein H6632_19605 [Anaerolineales bacterium]|nr:hypothetical protein [Anaerolineales bacterium]